MTNEAAQTSDITPEMGQRVLEQALDLWIRPEIERRSSRGVLEPDFRLVAAQIIFDLDADAPVVRLNGEVRALAQVRISVPVKAGDPVLSSEVVDFQRLELTEQDPNAGHITLILVRDSWFISFNFRYNAQRVDQTVALAEQFLASAENAQAKGHSNVAIDSLFSAVELLAKAWLLPTPPWATSTARTHRAIHGPFNREAKMGNAEAKYAALLNRLTALRPAARYMDTSLTVGASEIQAMCQRAAEMLEAVKLRAPRRDLSKEASSETDEAT